MAAKLSNAYTNEKRARKIVIGDKTPVKISYQEFKQLIEENDEAFELICEEKRNRKSINGPKDTSSSELTSSGKRSYCHQFSI